MVTKELVMDRVRHIIVLLAGFCSQLLCLGIARFAYTPLIPLMRADGLTESIAGLLAAVNYLGYFSGALIAVRLADWHWKFVFYRVGLGLAIVTTALMATTSNPWLWAISRYLAGLSSAASMLLASGLILHYLTRRRLRTELGLHFAGLGLGIALVALLVELFSVTGYAWSEQWWVLSGVAVLIAIPAWLGMPAPEPHLAISGNRAAPSVDAGFLWPLYLMYFCAYGL